MSPCGQNSHILHGIQVECLDIVLSFEGINSPLNTLKSIWIPGIPPGFQAVQPGIRGRVYVLPINIVAPHYCVMSIHYWIVSITSLTTYL